MSGSHNLPVLVVGIAWLGYRGPIRPHALSSLVAYADEYGVAEVLSWVREDSGLLFVPSWQFPMGWQMRKEDPMLHRERRWCVAPVESAEALAEKLTAHTWTLCTAFSLGGYLFLNDSTSEDSAQEYAVVKRTAAGVLIQVESITFGWCARDQALGLIRQVLAGTFDAEGFFGPVTLTLEPSGQHHCGLCA